MTAATMDPLTFEEVWEETTVLPPVPCELSGHDEHGDGPAQYRAVLHHDNCGRHDLTLMCEACLITLHTPHSVWICIRCGEYAWGGLYVTDVARLLGRA